MSGDVPELERVSDIARERRLRVCVAESLTSGRLANTVGAGGEASAWFAGGIVAYLTDVKERVLGVIPGTDPCSSACAEQLAVGALRLFDADICVSTTGVGGPGPESGHPAGTVHLGWATASASGHRSLALAGDPEEVLESSTAAAVRLLAFHLEGVHAPGPRRHKGGSESQRQGASPILSGASEAEAAASASSISAS